MKNLIITSSFGYHPVQLIPFLESAHRACQEADVTIITTPSDAARYGNLKERYPNLSFFLIPERKRSRTPAAKGAASQPWQRLKKAKLIALLLLKSKLGLRPIIRHNRSSVLGLSMLNVHVCLRRYFAARDLLAERGDRAIASVLLADVRDVIFQSDPFAHVSSGRYTGDEILKVKDCHSNAVWIKAAYGEEIFHQLADKVSVCSGVSIGTIGSMREYLDAFCQETIRVMQDKCLDTLPVWDQAFHIKMLLLDGFPFQTVPWNGFVATVAQAAGEHLRVNADGLVEVDGRVPAILHQYDRHPPIQEHIHATYR
ncbi:hypothetical protein VB738_03055 [Cyanobium gracile UHCC 0139]|uniref:Uncharacterized protein n=1 Tax=Cyanobium gracile UHCC 0139 TaxID=3110308 RepID=A0ABU5RR54_9CYAN|nr:hypothetical protein [Cyanobium gracile]MEA5390233.1 hypothetical protein [Cyanobium gracile UHCC 0139]